METVEVRTIRATFTSEGGEEITYDALQFWDEGDAEWKRLAGVKGINLAGIAQVRRDLSGKVVLHALEPSPDAAA